jgi:hypothetical protein
MSSSQQHRKTIAICNGEFRRFHPTRFNRGDPQVSGRLLEIEADKAEHHLDQMWLATNLVSHISTYIQYIFRNVPASFGVPSKLAASLRLWVKSLLASHGWCAAPSGDSISPSGQIAWLRLKLGYTTQIGTNDD